MELNQARVDGVLDTLDALRYPDVDGVEEALREGVSSITLRNLLASLAQQCASVARVDAVVSTQSEGDDPDLFVIELASFLKEYGCSIAEFEHDVKKALATPDNRLRLLEYMASEACACRFLAKQDSAAKDSAARSAAAGSASTPAQHLTTILDTLGITHVSGQSTQDIFKAIEAKIIELSRDVGGKAYLPQLLLKTKLSAEQWKRLEEIHRVLADEYSVRRDMLLKRLDVTIQSFKWSDRAKTMLDKIEATYQPKRRLLTSASSVDCSDVLFAGTDLTTVLKTSSSAVREKTQTPLTRMVIGSVPDRGGRPSESRPPPEMPRFRQRTTSAAKEQRGDKGPRVQGGWKQDGAKGGGGQGGRGRGNGGGNGRGGNSQGWGRKVVTD